MSFLRRWLPCASLALMLAPAACGGESGPPPSGLSGSGGGGGATTSVGGAGGEGGGSGGAGAGPVGFCGSIDLGDHTGDSPAGSPEVLATGLTSPVRLALAGDDVVVADAPLNGDPGVIGLVPSAGGAFSTLASTNVEGVAGLVVHGGSAYWANELNPLIMRVPLTGGSEEMFVSSGNTTAIAGGPAALFGSYVGYVQAFPFDGGEEYQAMFDIAVATSIVVHDGWLYGADLGQGVGAEFPAGRILRAPLDGSDQTVLVEGQNRLLQIDAQPGFLTWLDGGTNDQINADAAIWLLAADCGAEPIQLVSAADRAFALAAAGTEVIFTTLADEGAVWGVDVSDGSVTLYARGSGARPWDVVADAGHVYWVDNATGELLRAARR